MLTALFLGFSPAVPSAEEPAEVLKAVQGATVVDAVRAERNAPALSTETEKSSRERTPADARGGKRCNRQPGERRVRPAGDAGVVDAGPTPGGATNERERRADCRDRREQRPATAIVMAPARDTVATQSGS
jgi:hypothetical protein